MSVDSVHERLMHLALRAARRYRPSPNPRVGALVARAGRVIAVGAHRRAGEPHAEVEAISQAGARARGADLYVTLEPCNHFGLTPRCTDAIRAAGLRRVFIGCRDPNPHVPGRGIASLRRAGVEVVEGVCAEQAQALIEDFTKAMRQGLPLVTLKLAQTVDGRIATRTGDSRWVTSPRSRMEGHRLRATHDAILVGIGTVLADDPSLTTRLVRGPSPLRVVIDSSLRTPPRSALLRGGAIVFHAEQAGGARRQRLLQAAGAELIRVRARSGRVDLRAVLARLVERGALSVLVEGGAEIASSMLELELVDRVAIFVSPRIVGGVGAVPAVGGRGVARLDRAHRIDPLRIRRLGEDLLLEGPIMKRRS